jgi:Phospholipid-translocating ATPase N-terminal
MESNVKEFLVIKESNENDHHLNEEYCVKINKNQDINTIDLETNCISTSKYTFLNCIPKILIEQFSKMANIYFLMIAIMQVSFYSF